MSENKLFNLRLSPDERMRMRLIAGYKGLGNESACVRWLLAEKWEELKGDIAVAVVAEKRAAEPAALVYEEVTG